MDDARTYAPRVHSQNSQLCRVHIKPQNRNDFEALFCYLYRMYLTHFIFARLLLYLRIGTFVQVNMLYTQNRLSRRLFRDYRQWSVPWVAHSTDDSLLRSTLTSKRLHPS